MFPSFVKCLNNVNFQGNVKNKKDIPDKYLFKYHIIGVRQGGKK